MRRQPLRDLPAFLTAARAAGARGVGMRVIDEIRPRQLDPLPDGAKHPVEVGPQRWIELSAYAVDAAGTGTVYWTRIDGADPEAVAQALASADLAVRRRSGNIG